MEFGLHITCIVVVLLVSGLLFIPGIGGGQTCASCIGTSQGDRCYSHTTCNDNEICRLDVYMNDAWNIQYDYGCSQACQHSTGPVIVGRSSNSVSHSICQICCNDTRLCNEKLSCEITPPTRAGQTCAICTGIESGSNCLSHTTCDENEVCQMIVYRNEAGRVFHDYGCALPQVCLHKADSTLVGRRANDVHHGICNLCCNDTAMCNDRLTCVTNTSTATHLPRECSDLVLSTKMNGTYTIYPYGTQQVHVGVRCEFDAAGNAWTVIQRRFNGSVNFNQTWDTYKTGFGSPYGEYWIGNDIIHTLTSYAHHSLLIVLSDYDNVTKHALYSNFSIGDESSAYVLHVSGYSGTAGDSLGYSSGKNFSTIDRDNDLSSGSSCVQDYDGAWWYGNCANSFLNGRYLGGHYAQGRKGIMWYHWRGFYYSLKTSTMMIRKD